MADASVALANIEEAASKSALWHRPRCLFVSVTFVTVLLFAGGGPGLAALLQEKTRVITYHAKVGAGRARAPATTAATAAAAAPLATAAGSSASPPPPPPPIAAASLATAAAATTTVAVAAGGSTGAPACGDGRCEPPETITSCMADCPGVTTPPQCGEEPHADPQGNAVVDGRGHHVKTAGECCAACEAHAAKHPQRPCNSWVFCYMPHCWSADNGNTHLFGECWLKWQADPKHPLYGQRGKYAEDFRKRNRDKHLSGSYPTDKNSVDAMKPFGIVPGSRRNLTVPTHVAWTGGVLGAKVDLGVTWETAADGGMRSSAGELVVDYRPWESREQNLRRGVKPEQMKF